MPDIEKMKDQLAEWGLIQQVWELKDSGYTLVESIMLVYAAHTRGTPYRMYKGA